MWFSSGWDRNLKSGSALSSFVFLAALEQGSHKNTLSLFSVK